MPAPRPAAACAEGELNIYNWGNYTSPELIKKFEEAYKVKVTVTDYDSNDTALAKVRAGGHGFDIVVPSANFVPIWIKEGLLLESRPDQMENFKNVDPRWVDVALGSGPPLHRAVAVGHHRRRSSTPRSTAATSTPRRSVFDPPAELVGKINVVPEMNDVMSAAIKYVGGELVHRRQGAAEEGARQAGRGQAEMVSMDYGVTEKFAKGDYRRRRTTGTARVMRSRLPTRTSTTAIPRKAIPICMDSVAILKDAKNVDNAKLFHELHHGPGERGA